ncbi:MAG: IS66 family transposase, partial [Eggerthellaceae bacterium]|nr:IS66 family transposase [Eggerthellaceae bacterium]
MEEVFGMEDVFYQLLQQMKELTEQLQQQSEQLQQQSEQLQQQSEQLSTLQEIIAAKDAQIAALTAQIEELTHKKNSGNSSKPPSSERLNKPAPKSLRTKSGKPAGGQPGHKGSGMKIDREPDEVIEHRPAQCEGCPHAATCKLRCCETRYEYEAVVETKLIAHKVLGCKACTLTGEAVQGTFPSNITGAKQYGPGVAGLAVSLLVNGYMSVDRVQKLLKSLRIPISTGAIQEMLTKAAKLVQEPVERICQTVTGLPVTHYDETGLRVVGKLHWLHCACDEQWRYYTVQEKRGQEGITDMGVLPNASGVAVHDFWKPYRKYDNVDHAMCCAPLERELVYAHETGNQAWAKHLRELLQTLCHRRKVLQSEGKDAFPDQELAEYLESYDRLVTEGLDANPIPERIPGKRGRKAEGKFRCLLERFRDFKEDILRFARDWSVPYTNNTAEQAIRCARVKEKVSGCFRTKSGADDFAQILSFVSTAALHGVS